MKTLTKLSMVGLLALMAFSAYAQGFGGGGQGRRGGMGMMRMGGMSSPTMLLVREDVQEDLALTSEQKSALKDAQEAQRAKMMETFQAAFASGERPDPKTMQEMGAKMMKESEAEVNKILKPEQQTRLKEIHIQLEGNRAAMIPDVQKTLEVTDAQKAKLKALQEGSQTANQSVMEKVRAREIQFTEVQDIMKKNEKILNDEIAKVLTQKQKDKLVEMGGKKFVEKVEDN